MTIIGPGGNGTTVDEKWLAGPFPAQQWLMGRGFRPAEFSQKAWSGSAYGQAGGGGNPYAAGVGVRVGGEANAPAPPKGEPFAPESLAGPGLSKNTGTWFDRSNTVRDAFAGTGQPVPALAKAQRDNTIDRGVERKVEQNDRTALLMAKMQNQRQMQMRAEAERQAAIRQRAVATATTRAQAEALRRAQPSVGNPVYQDYVPTWNPATGQYEKGDATTNFTDKTRPGSTMQAPPGWEGDIRSEDRIFTGDYQDSRSGGVDRYEPRPTVVRSPVVKKPIYKQGDQWSYGVTRQLSSADVSRLQRALVLGGMADPTYMSKNGTLGYAERNGLGSLMGYANLRGQTVDEYINWMEEQASGGGYGQTGGYPSGGGSSGGGGGGGGGPLTTTDTSYAISSMDQARQALRDVMQQQLGRAPSDDEVKKFVARLNAAERKAPIITTVTVNPSGSTQTSVKQDKTVDPREEARGYVTKAAGKEKQGYGEASYYDVLAGMMGG